MHLFRKNTGHWMPYLKFREKRNRWLQSSTERKEKMTISSREEADRIMEELKGVSYQVSEVKRERGKKLRFHLLPALCSRKLPRH